MTQVPRFLTARQAAERLEVDETTVRAWAKSGKLAAIVYPSGQMRFLAEDIDAILKPAVAGSVDQRSSSGEG